MGIQDRDYYRNEGPSILDSLMPQGLVCRWLIGINIAVFVLQFISQRTDDGRVTEWLILDVDKVRHGEVWRLLTYAFLHSTGSIWHILFNMLFLWWFGSDVEQLYGRKQFLAIYLMSAFLGGAAYEIYGLVKPTGPCLGASGAVTTMLILYALHFPRRIIYLFGIVPMPIWVFAIFCVLADTLGLFGVSVGGPVAFIVHLAGAAFAVAYYKWQGRIVEWWRSLGLWKYPRPRSRLKLFDPDADREEPVAVAANSAPQAAMDEHLEAKLDAVLEKIAKSGKESLTKQEQEILRQAAEMYKRRRS